jgi:hypothetical protein
MGKHIHVQTHSDVGTSYYAKRKFSRNKDSCGTQTTLYKPKLKLTWHTEAWLITPTSAYHLTKAGTQAANLFG